MTPFENMTDAENDFFERMKTAPEEQRAVFRTALNILMTCFGDDPPGSLLALHLDRDAGEMKLHCFNLAPPHPPMMLRAALAAIHGDVENVAVH